MVEFLIYSYITVLTVMGICTLICQVSNPFSKLYTWADYVFVVFLVIVIPLTLASCAYFLIEMLITLF